MDTRLKWRGWIAEENLNPEALDYMRAQLVYNESFADMIEEDKIQTLMIISDAIQHYLDGISICFHENNFGSREN